MVRFSANEFQLNRAIAIVGSGGVGLITLLLCLLCQLKPQRSLTEELHIIVGFYVFCELFICCMIIVECVNVYSISKLLVLSNLFFNSIDIDENIKYLFGCFIVSICQIKTTAKNTNL